jgi:predicted RecA/RadA family phage recombinase
MATNFKQPGDIVSYTLQSGETSTVNRPIWVGNIQGIADRTGVAGDSINILRCGIFETLPKTTGTAWTVGQPIYWDATNNKGITTDETGKLLGHAAVAATSGATTGDILLLEDPLLRHSAETTATLASGTVTVTDARCTATSRIYLTRVAVNSSTALGEAMAVAGSGSYVISARTPGTPGTPLAGDLSTFNVRIDY